MRTKLKHPIVACFASCALAASSALATSAMAAPEDDQSLSNTDIIMSRAPIGAEHEYLRTQIVADRDTQVNVTIRNYSNLARHDMVFDFEVPDNTNIVSTGSAQCTVHDSQNASCQLPTLPAEGKVQFDFTVNVASSAEVSVNFQGALSTKTDRFEQDFDFQLVSGQADLSVTQKPAQTYRGVPGGIDGQRWDVIITNHSNTSVTDVHVLGKATANATNSDILVSWDDDYWSNDDISCFSQNPSNDWLCHADELAPNQSITIPVEFNIDGLPCPGSTFTQEVWVGPFVTDPVVDNNYHKATAAVEHGLDIDQCPVSDGAVFRVGDRDRFGTAAQISRYYFGAANVVYLASGLDYPDALAASAAAGFKDSPVLLTRPNELPDTAKAELKLLEPGRVVVVGGPAAVSDTVVAQVKATLPQVQVERMGGKNRFDTAAKIAGSTFPAAERVFIASGMDFPDALSSAAAAGAQGAPVLLSTRDGFPEESAAILRKLQPKRVVIVGGEGVVSAKAAAQIQAAAKGVAPIRYGGANRFETTRLVALGEFKAHPDYVVMANAFDYPDALVGAAVAGSKHGPVLLTATNELAEDTIHVLRKLVPNYALFVGGEGVISQRVLNDFRIVTGMRLGFFGRG